MLLREKIKIWHLLAAPKCFATDQIAAEILTEIYEDSQR